MESVIISCCYRADIRSILFLWLSNFTKHSSAKSSTYMNHGSDETRTQFGSPHHCKKNINCFLIDLNKPEILRIQGLLVVALGNVQMFKKTGVTRKIRC